jgi:hypothetical protein
MKKLLWALCLLAGPALAADINISWVNPTANTDGSAIPSSGAGSLSGTRVEWGSCSGTAFGTALGERIVAAPATSTVVTGLSPATYCARAFARNTYGVESLASNVASRVVSAPVPQPPTIVAIAVVAGLSHAPVYSITGAGKLSTLMGFVPVGKACSSTAVLTYRGTTFYEVARSDVQWWGSTTLRVAAPCAARVSG